MAYDFNSDDRADLPITSRVANEMRELARVNTGAKGLLLPGFFAQSLLDGIAQLEARVNSLEQSRGDQGSSPVE